MSPKYTSKFGKTKAAVKKAPAKAKAKAKEPVKETKTVKGYDVDRIEEFVKQNPDVLIHFLHNLDSKGFSLIKDIISQHITGKSRSIFPKIVEKMKRSHELYHPMNDIYKNCKNKDHLARVLESDKGGSIWSSLWKGIKSVFSFTNNNIVKKLPSLAKIEKKTKAFLDYSAPIALAVDSSAKLFGKDPGLRHIRGNVSNAFEENPTWKKYKGVDSEVRDAFGQWDKIINPNPKEKVDKKKEEVVTPTEGDPETVNSAEPPEGGYV